MRFRQFRQRAINMRGSGVPQHQLCFLFNNLQSKVSISLHSRNQTSKSTSTLQLHDNLKLIGVLAKLESPNLCLASLIMHRVNLPNLHPYNIKKWVVQIYVYVSASCSRLGIRGLAKLVIWMLNCSVLVNMTWSAR